MKRLAATAITMMLTAAIGVAAMGTAAAGPYDGYGYRYQNGPYGPGYYGYARVVNVVPVVEIVNQAVSREQCYAPVYNGYYREPSRTGGNLIGALIGGALGNTVGKGDGRRAATIVGAAAGYAIADNVQRDQRVYGYGGRGYYSNAGCQVVTQYVPENRVIGYNVTYDYRGRIEQVRTTFNPGDNVWVRIAV